MSAKSPRAAIKLVAEDLQAAASCVTRSVLRAEIVTGDATRATIGFAGAPRARAGKAQQRWISINVAVVATQDDPSGAWRTHTSLYDFSLYEHPIEGDFSLAYHFHPSPDGRGHTEPHLHVGAQPSWGRGLKKKHLPTGRISAEDFVRLLIEELDIGRQRSDWAKVLSRGEQRFAERRTW